MSDTATTPSPTGFPYDYGPWSSPARGFVEACTAVGGMTLDRCDFAPGPALGEAIALPSPEPGTAAPRKASSRPKPRWVSREGELWYKGDRVLHIARRRAQSLILAEFQKKRWARRIGNPLTGGPPEELEARLRDACKHLNRRQKPLRIRFSVEADGRGVRWDPVE